MKLPWLKYSNNPSYIDREETISIILPTRKRSNELYRLVNSIFLTSTHHNKIEICIYIDNDDTESETTIKKLINDYSELAIKYTTCEEKLNLSQMWNYAYENLATGNIIMHCGDDIVFRTDNWDVAIRNEFNKYPDNIVLVFCKDGIQNAGLATHSFVHRRWIEVSGFWLPPYFVSDYNDTWLDHVSIKIHRRVYLDNIYTEHMHYIAGKSIIDENTQRRLDRHERENPGLLYSQKENERNEHANRLLEYIKSLH
jgi:glycosyltransferase involved in cell wall biosynthesis